MNRVCEFSNNCKEYQSMQRKYRLLIEETIRYGCEENFKKGTGEVHERKGKEESREDN